MPTTINNQTTEIITSLKVQHSAIHDGGAHLNWRRDTDGNTVFYNLNSPRLKVGLVEIGLLGHRESPYVFVATKVGNIMVYLDAKTNTVRYACAQEYWINQSARQAGFNSCEGVVETIDQLNHFFKIIASYKD